MAFDLGASGLKDISMKLSSLGRIVIEATPKADNKEILMVDIVTEGRSEPQHLVTNRDETVDQFAQRIKSALRGMWNSPHRTVETVTPAESPAKPLTFEEQKADIRKKAGK